ncbi:nadp-binding [Trichoderma arundinaceum]|uniref:Nadp-binding n=1 Tax=Trichoderma arundinaceum TaxID=490622 RepID=A0A395NYB0_TRIAR|nr:nadp-binding [Trichoderma arundinaceum]
MGPVLFLGVSGQIGGAFITSFREKYPDIPITFYLRSAELDGVLHSLGNSTIVHGSFDQLHEIEMLASSHPVVFNFATSINTAVTEAIIRGARSRKVQTGETPVVYHLSGAGNFVDNSESGDYVPTDHRFDDANPDDVRTISASNMPNGPCDELLFAAARKGDAKLYFVCPSGTYGHSRRHIGRSVGSATAFAPGRWVDYMMQNTEALGFGAYVGSGTSVFGVVHVDDIVSLMMLVYQRILDTVKNYQPEDVYSHWYNGVYSEEPSKRIAAAFAKLQARRSKIASAEIRSVAYKDAGLTARYIAGNMLIQCNNSLSLGWKPQGPDLYTALEQLE